MNKKEIVENIKSLIFNKEEKVENNFVNAKLEDGTIVMTDGEEFEIGKEIFIVSEDGTKELAPEGEHTLEDGSIVKVAEGKIVEILEAEEELEEEVENEMESEEETKEVETDLEKEEDEMESEEDKEEMESDKEELKKEIEMLKEELKEMKDKMKEKEEMAKEEFSKVENLNEATKYILEFIENSPASEKLEVKKEGFYSKIQQNNISKKEKNQQEIAKFFAERNKK